MYCRLTLDIVLIYNDVVVKVQGAKFLCLHIDENFSCHFHTNHVARILSKFSCNLYRVTSFLNDPSSLLAYNSLTLSTSFTVGAYGVSHAKIILIQCILPKKGHQGHKKRFFSRLYNTNFPTKKAFNYKLIIHIQLPVIHF